MFCIVGLHPVILPLNSAGNFTGTQAPGAGVDVFVRTVHNRFHALYVGLPHTVAPTVGMGYLDTK